MLGMPKDDLLPQAIDSTEFAFCRKRARPLQRFFWSAFKIRFDLLILKGRVINDFLSVWRVD